MDITPLLEGERRGVSPTWNVRTPDMPAAWSGRLRRWNYACLIVMPVPKGTSLRVELRIRFTESGGHLIRFMKRTETMKQS
jgi:hypothetical protein